MWVGLIYSSEGLSRTKRLHPASKRESPADWLCTSSVASFWFSSRLPSDWSWNISSPGSPACGPNGRLWTCHPLPSCMPNAYIKTGRSWNRKIHEILRSFDPYDWIFMSFLLEKGDKASVILLQGKYLLLQMDSLLLQFEHIYLPISSILMRLVLPFLRLTVT